MWLSGQVFLTMRLQRMWAKGTDIPGNDDRGGDCKRAWTSHWRY